SQLHAPSATQVFPRAGYTSPKASAPDHPPIASIQPTMDEITAMYESDRHPSPGLLKDKIKDVASLILKLSTGKVRKVANKVGKVANKTGPSVFHYIARIKYFIATWEDPEERGVAEARWANAEEREVAIANIKACEAAAIAKFPHLENKPAEALKLMENFIKAESNESFPNSRGVTRFCISRSLHPPLYQIQDNMIIIRPQVLISASFILLALLLVSATPIPSPFVVSGATIDALETRNSDKPKAELHNLSDNPIASNEQKLAFTIGQVAGVISEMPAEEVLKPDTGTLVFRTIVCSKFTVAKWGESKGGEVSGAGWAHLQEREAAITNIKACEAAAIAKFPHLENKPAEALKLMGNFIGEDTAPGLQLHELDIFVEYLSKLSLVQQGTIREELEKGYTTVQNKINGWTDDHCKQQAETELRVWRWLSSLVDVNPSQRV
ncbi:hypothetical protein H0H93_015685, partial [Arthromyces matolae]